MSRKGSRSWRGARTSGSRLPGRCGAAEAQARHLCAGLSCWGRASMRRAASAMPALALTLLTTRDKGEAAQIAQELERLNRERQEIELAVVDQAMVQADNMLGKERRGAGAGGVAARAGIRAWWGWPPRASRNASTCRASCWRRTSDGRLAAGSGRSIAGRRSRQLRCARRFEAGLIVKGGGHAMAAGLTRGDGAAGRPPRLPRGAAGRRTWRAAPGPALAIDAAV